MISQLETMNTRVWNSYTDEAIRILKEAGLSDFSAAEKEGKPRVKIAEKREREESGSGSNDVSDKTELKKINPEKNERDPNPFALFTNPPGPGISNSNQQEIDRLGSGGM
jgi:hypothetical protein